MATVDLKVGTRSKPYLLLIPNGYISCMHLFYFHLSGHDMGQVSPIMSDRGLKCRPLHIWLVS